VTVVSADRYTFARACETLATNYLSGLGWRILARNYHTRFGELDIVARDGRDLVFVEVKGKRGVSHGAPLEMVDRRKRDHLLQAALIYLSTAEWRGRSCRFDVVAVMARPGEEPGIDHLKDAFGLGDR
jgi:putative endonuclease